MAANPFKADPSRTGLVRQRYSAEMTRRFKTLADAAETYLDARLTTNARFPSDGARAAEFTKWRTAKAKKGLLTDWQTEYVRSAYRTGITNAYLNAHKKELDALGPDSLNAFLREAFDVAENVGKLKRLYSRAFENLKNVTTDMAQDLREVLTQGLADGKSPRVIAREVAAKIARIGKDRGLKIARTEVIHAHAEGQLDSFERLGIETVGAEVEWLSTPDQKRCALCAELDGQRFTMAEARGKLPRHPSCRCSWTPALT